MAMVDPEEAKLGISFHQYVTWWNSRGGIQEDFHRENIYNEKEIISVKISEACI